LPSRAHELSREAALELAPKQPVPVFPLPDFVLFPRAVAPLHVFELRYRAMVRDVLRGERRIAFALLMPGWEHDYQGSPAFYPLGCLAQVESVTWQPDDCFDLWISGLSRVHFQRVTSEYPYRAARVSLVPQEPIDEDDPLVQLERRSLNESYEKIPESARLTTPAPGGWVIDDGRRLSFEGFVNAVCGALSIAPAEKLALLELDSLIERARKVRERIELGLRAPTRAGEGGHN
jgi:hypothetical protein